MQAIILAAGKGERLKPLTDVIPKCMVKIKNKPLIYNALDILAASNKFDEVLIVCGYLAEVVQTSIGSTYCGMKIRYINNHKFNTTNNVYSLYLVDNWVKEDCLLLECDLYYEQDAIDTIISGNADCNILVSPFNRNKMDGTIIIAEGNTARELIIKAHQYTNREYKDAYKTVNIYKFKEAFFNRKLMPALRNYVKTGNLQSYYELVIGGLIYYRNDNIQINILNESRWFEIDDIQDYKKIINILGD